MSEKSKFAEISDLALRRGIYFPSAEIYSDVPAGFWDYGPLGVALKRRIIDLWRKTIVKRDDMLEIDGSLILPENVFEASGHLQNFVDPLVECKKCGEVFRADRLIQNILGKLIPESLPSKELDSLISKNGVVCSKCKGELFNVYKFNMMFRFSAGPRMGNKVALRPETCQSIFLDFLRVYNSMRAKLPIGLAQVGKSFRNEISPRRNLIRLRELTQAEIEVFFNPKKIDFFTKFDSVKDVPLTFFLVNDQELSLSAEKAVNKKIVQNKLVAYYLVLLQEFYNLLGIQSQNLRYRELCDEERPFYAQSAWDLEIKTSLGWLEVVANHYRTDYDLRVHSKGSKTDLRILDDSEKLLPWVWEASMGIDRTLFIVLDAAYTHENKRKFLKLPSYLAPIQVAVFPLVAKNGLPEKARSVYNMLKVEIDAFFDEKASIGRRYYRVDEIGVPYGVTIDYGTLKDDTVTIRERDTKKQVRIKIDSLKDWLKPRLTHLPNDE